MRALLPLVLLPACLVAPDRPTGEVPPGATVDVLPPGCLAGTTRLTAGTVGRLPSGRDALFRASTDSPRVYEFTSFGTPNCYALAFDAPTANAPVTAMDIALDSGHDVLALMTEEAFGVLLVEIALDGANGSLLSTSQTAIVLTPAIVTSDDIGVTPRFLHRVAPAHELWFGGANAPKIGIAAEASPGTVGLAALLPVMQGTPDDEVWLDAVPLPDLATDGASAVLVGEAETCAGIETANPKSLACDPALLRANDGCTRMIGRCPSRGTHLLADSTAAVGYSLTQPHDDIIVELVTPNAQAATTTLPIPTISSEAYGYAIDGAISQGASNLDAVALWWDDLVGTRAGIAYYEQLGPETAQPATSSIKVTGSPTDLRAGSFTADSPQVLVIGDTAADVQCFDIGSALSTCAP